MVDIFPFSCEILCGSYDFKLQAYPKLHYKIEENDRNIPYLIAYCIYPNCPLFVKQIHSPVSAKKRNFTWEERICKEGYRNILPCVTF